MSTICYPDIGAMRWFNITSSTYAMNIGEGALIKTITERRRIGRDVAPPSVSTAMVFVPGVQVQGKPVGDVTAYRLGPIGEIGGGWSVPDPLDAEAMAPRDDESKLEPAVAEQLREIVDEAYGARMKELAHAQRESTVGDLRMRTGDPSTPRSAA